MSGSRSISVEKQNPGDDTKNGSKKWSKWSKKWWCLTRRKKSKETIVGTVGGRRKEKKKLVSIDSTCQLMLHVVWRRLTCRIDA